MMNKPLEESPNKKSSETLSIDVDSANVNIGNVTVNADSTEDDIFSGVEATFSHTLSDFETAAKKSGGGHFNWLTLVSSGTNLKNQNPDDPSRSGQQPAPYPRIDPLKGGNLGFGFYLSDDSLPFYWGEESPTADEVPNNIDGNQFTFVDVPNLSTSEGAVWNFETYLVSVPGEVSQTEDKTFTPLMGFEWQFEQVDTDPNIRKINGLKEIEPDTAELNTVLAKQHNFPEWEAVSLSLDNSQSQSNSSQNVDRASEKLGSDANDTLISNAPETILSGGKGDDTLISNAPGTILSGGEGNDRYVFKTNSDANTISFIEDFELTQDFAETIEFSDSLGICSFEEIQQNITEDGLIISNEGKEIVQLTNVQTKLDASNFIFA